MKNKITLNFLLITLCISFFSCEKEIVQQGRFGPIETTNCYILRKIKAEIYSQNNADTILYSNLRIGLYFAGDLVSEGNDSSTVDIVDSYFVNVIKSMKITANKKIEGNYNVTESFSTDYYQNIQLKTLHGKNLGFSPKNLFLMTAPSNSNYYSFTIEITDIYDNYFVATTDSIFITK